MNLLYEKSRVKTESGNQRVHSEGGGGPVQRTGGAQPPYQNTKHSWRHHPAGGEKMERERIPSPHIMQGEDMKEGKQMCRCNTIHGYQAFMEDRHYRCQIPVAGELPHACSDHPPSSMLFFILRHPPGLPLLHVIYECNIRATVKGGRAPNGTPWAV